MKKVSLLAVAVLALMSFSFKASAQAPASFFAGKWDILIKGTPNGDVHMMTTFKDSAGVVTGTFGDLESGKEVPFTKIEKKDAGIVVYFSAQGYDLNMPLEKKDDEHITGSLMGMFEATGSRVKK